MFKDYEKMSNEELEKLGRKYHLQGVLEEGSVLTEDRKIISDFVVNRRNVIEQLSQRDTRKIAYHSLILSVVAILISLIIGFISKI